jgi:hypothetical protein
MVAVGAINWDYQRHHAHVLLNSSLIIVPGLLLLALTFFDAGKKLLQFRAVQILWTLVGIAALIYAFTNK